MRRATLLVVCALLAAACGDTTEPTVTLIGFTPTTTTELPVPPAAGPDTAGLLVASPGVVRAEPATSAPISELASGLNNAGFALWKRQPVEDNMAFSPASIGHALLMSRPAADDATGAAIDRALGLPAGLSAHQAWNVIDQQMAAAAAAAPDSRVEIAIADRVWPGVGATPDQAWLDLLMSEHGVTAESLDFAGDPEGSRQRINAWVADATKGLIEELAPPGVITPRTELVLTDAIYFAADWQEFFHDETELTSFTRLDGSTVSPTFMRNEKLRDRKGAGDGFVGAELPYWDPDFAMLLIVPDEGRFEEVRSGLDQEFLDELDATFTAGPFRVIMPQWSGTTQFDLMPWLREIGAAPGHYPGISEGIFLAGAQHAADITVDKLGTVAAAATGLVYELSGPPEPELIIEATRPFLYLIRHRPSGLVLFVGQVTDPTA